MWRSLYSSRKHNAAQFWLTQGLSQLSPREAMRAIVDAGDVDVLLLDKTGPIAFSNRQTTVFTPCADTDAGPTEPRCDIALPLLRGP